MRINFCLRADGRSKPGGDTSQVAHLATRLRALGHDVDTTFGSVGRGSYDIAHLINIDLPLENLALLARGASAAGRVVLSTIHHPFAGIRECYHSGVDPLFERLRRAGMPFERAPTMREALKLLRREHRLSRWALSTATHAQRTLASRVDLLLPLSIGEQRALRADLDTEVPCCIVPNGMTFGLKPSTAAREPRWDVVVVGRVEPRKNTLALARAVSELGLRGLFLGAINTNHPGYARQFTELARREDAITYLGAIPHDQVAQKVSQSAAYVNASWFEVIPQADVEAACLGTRVVTTKYSYVADVIGPHQTLDPAAVLRDGARALAEALDKARPCPPPSLETWESAGACLEQAYLRALADEPVRARV